jgi:hypothetical protein
VLAAAQGRTIRIVSKSYHTASYDLRPEEDIPVSAGTADIQVQQLLYSVNFD